MLWTSMSFYQATFRIGSFAGIFTTGTLSGIWIERKRQSENVEQLFKPDIDSSIVTHKVEIIDPKIERAKSILKYGAPQSLSPGTLYHENHVLEFDPIRKTPLWVAEHITQHHVNPEIPQANRKKSKFLADLRLEKEIRSSNDDFWDSGWSRGHMAPAGNNKHSQTAMDDTFLLSNIVPQDFDNNGDFWNRTEIYCRDLTKKYSDVRVISGPLWLPLDETKENMIQSHKLSNSQPKVLKNGRPQRPHKIVSYPVIGINEVAVPTHLYKIILAEDKELEKPLMSAFIVPNEPIEKDKTLIDFQVKVQDLERRVGFRFHRHLAEESVNDLCSIEGCTLMKYREFQAYFIHRGLKGARNAGELERYWRQANKYGFASDANIQSAYKNRFDELDKTAEATNNMVAQ